MIITVEKDTDSRTRMYRAGLTYSNLESKLTETSYSRYAMFKDKRILQIDYHTGENLINKMWMSSYKKKTNTITNINEFWLNDSSASYQITRDFLVTRDFPDDITMSTVWHDCTPVVVLPGDRIREIIRDRLMPTILTRRRSLSVPDDIREIRARATLKRVLGLTKFRRFLRDGHITIRGKSGRIYQIFPGYGMTCVFEKGVMVEQLCAVLRGNFPPTDSLIMRYLLILNNEEEFRKYALPHSPSSGIVSVRSVDNEPLPQIFARLKAVA